MGNLKKRDWIWIALAVVLLVLVLLVSGVFYLSLYMGSPGTGHVVFVDDSGGDGGNESDSGFPVVEGDVIFEEIGEAG